MNTTDMGKFGEKEAVRFLKKRRYRILERNLHVSHNELDIVAIDKRNKAAVFVEVKTRSVDDNLTSSFGSPASAVTRTKQLRTLEAARGYIATNPRLHALAIRFDVIEVYVNKESKEILKLNHIENAFGV